MVQMAANRGQKRLGIQRFGEIRVAARLKALHIVAAHRVGGQGDHRDPAPRGPQPAGGLISVHLGHLHVHQDQVK